MVHTHITLNFQEKILNTELYIYLALSHWWEVVKDFLHSDFCWLIGSVFQKVMNNMFANKIAKYDIKHYISSGSFSYWLKGFFHRNV